MFDDLEHYLSTIMSVERVDGIIRLLNYCTVLVGIEPTMSFSQYSYGIPADIDQMEEISRFDDAWFSLLTACFSELGIVLDAEVLDSSKIPDVEKLAQSLILIADWEDSDRLLGILSSADDLEMAVAEVAGEIQNEDASVYAILIQSVSTAFYNNLLQLVESNAESNAGVQTPVDPMILARVKTHFSGRGESFVSKLITDGVFTYALGYPFYLKFYENNLYDEQPTDIVRSLVDFAICSDVADKDVCATAAAAIGNYADTIELGISFKNLMADYINLMPVAYGGGGSEAK